MKKIALLITLVLAFSLSTVFATDAEVILSENPALASGEVQNTENVVVQTELSGENTETSGDSEVTETVSGDLSETISGDLENNESAEKEDTTANSSSNSAMVGAIIAIVIVIAVVAIVAILRKD